MFHHHWVKTTGRLVDSRVRTIWHSHDGGELSGPGLTLHNYIVEFQTPNGEVVKREVEQQVDTIDVGIGREVPLLVSPDGTEAVFDKKDPSINVLAVNQANKQANEERFRKQLEG